MTTSPSLLSASLLAALAAMALPAHAAEVTLTVTTLADNYNDPVPGSLRAAINTANASPGDSYVINFNVAGGGTLTLGAQGAGGGGAAMLPILTNPSGIRIDGANGGQGAITINGGSTSTTTGDRIFFVGVPPGMPSSTATGVNMAATTTTTFAISNLRLENGNARGGAGAQGRMGGGGGAGLGGAIFVNAGTLNLTNVALNNNQAVGGAGGLSASTLSGRGGGGGMGGAGGESTAARGGGGGGFGLGAAGASATTLPLKFLAGEGSFTGGRSGGFGGSGHGGKDGGGGGLGVSGGTSRGGAGGVGSATSYDATVSNGGVGGFGGGGGGMNSNLGTAGRSTGGYGGGSGGGGGSTGSPFGGGGGGSVNTTVGTTGFGGGAGGTFSGTGSGGGGAGGGLAAGGAIFVRSGATLTVTDGGLSNGSVTGGAGSAGFNNGTAGTAGSAIGTGIFLAGKVTYTVSANNTLTIADTIGGGVNTLIRGGFTKTGDGRLVLSGANDYVGGTTVSGGVLELQGTAADKIGGLTLVNAGGTLQTDVTGVTFTMGKTTEGTTQLTASKGFVDGIALNGGAFHASGFNTYAGDMNVAGHTLVLAGSNTLTAPVVTVSGGGRLLANNASGSATGGADIAVQSMGTFGGSGAIDGSITVEAGGTLAPGASIESLASGSVSLTDASASFSAEVDVELPAADLLSVTGSVSLGGATLNLSAAPLTAFGTVQKTFLILANDGADAINGSFGAIACMGCTATVDYAFTGTDALGRIGDGNDLAVTVSQSLAPVPEPGTWALMAGGLLGLGAGMRSRRRH